MRICMIGKFPPIEGGVSVHQYWCAHSLAVRGHEVHVVTNAAEVEPQFRMWMRVEDWKRCEGSYSGGGRVSVHGTAPIDWRQRHIPAHNPFVSKLASLAAEVIRVHDLEVVFSYYLEPYAIAGHLAAQMTGRPHVVKHAGSDIGRLRLHPQLGPLYDHVLRSAASVVTGRDVAQQLRQVGVDESQMFLRDDFRLPETVFATEGPRLDLARLFEELAEDPDWAGYLRGRPLPEPPYLGTYGKLSEFKGTLDLLQAVNLLRRRGWQVSLLLVGNGWEEQGARITEAIARMELGDVATRLPFLPNWRIPEFIRLCQGVCFLEREFPITSHAPVIPREVFACGGCLIGSAEILQRQLFAERIVHGYNSVIVRNVRDPEELAARVGAVLEDAERARQIGLRGHQYSVETEQLRAFPGNYEDLFAEVIAGKPGVRPHGQDVKNEATDKFTWTRTVIDTLAPEKREEVTALTAAHGTGTAWALAVYAKILELVEKGELSRGILVEAMRLELRAAGVFQEGEQSESTVDSADGLFRLEAEPELVRDSELAVLCPMRVPGLAVESYEYDVGELLAARRRGKLPLWAPKRPSWVAVLPGVQPGWSRIISLSKPTIQLLEMCDGSQTIQGLATERCQELNANACINEEIVSIIIQLFRLGLVRLVHRRGTE